jgi:hypothetical protein
MTSTHAAAVPLCSSSHFIDWFLLRLGPTIFLSFPGVAFASVARHLRVLLGGACLRTGVAAGRPCVGARGGLEVVRHTVTIAVARLLCAALTELIARGNAITVVVRIVWIGDPVTVRVAARALDQARHTIIVVIGVE